MSDSNPEFSIFYKKISLSAAQKKDMRNWRQALHNRIRQYFQNKLNLHPPTFFSCGRQATDSTIASNYGELLMEEAVVLQHLGRVSISKWPQPESMHKLILNAIQGLTPDLPVDRKYSICVRYAGLYKIEISVLAPGPDRTLLAINGPDGGWLPDFRKNLADWFKIQVKCHGLQLHRIACYLNAWADFHPNQLQGFAWLLPLDILAAKYFRADIGRDDKSLARTAATIAGAAPGDLQWPISLAGDHTLPWPMSEMENQIFSNSLEVLVRRSRLASETKDKTRACAIWRSLLGEHFPMASAINGKFDYRTNGLPLGMNHSYSQRC